MIEKLNFKYMQKNQSTWILSGMKYSNEIYILMNTKESIPNILKSKYYPFQLDCPQGKCSVEKLMFMVCSVKRKKREHREIKISGYVIGFKFIVKRVGFDLKKR